MTEFPGTNPYEAPRAEHTFAASAIGAPLPWSPTDVLTYAFNRIKKDPMIAVAAFVSMLPGLVIGGIGEGIKWVVAPPTNQDLLWLNLTISVVVMIINVLVSIWIAVGLAHYMLNKCRGRDASIGDLFGGAPVMAGMGLQILHGIAVAVGMLLCIVPGVILTLGWLPSLTLLVDRRVGPIEALGLTWNLTNGHKVNLFVFWLLCICVMIAAAIIGLLALCIGVIVTVPFATAMIALGVATIYLKLSGQEPAPAQS